MARSDSFKTFDPRGSTMPVSTEEIKPLIQEAVARLLIQPLEQESVAFGLGVRFFDTSVPLSVPTLEGSFSPDWVGENEQIPEHDGVDFGSVKLMPTSMDSVKSLVRLSNESLRASSQALDSVLQARLLTDVATKIDTQFFSNLGNGTTTPQGLLAWSGTQSVDAETGWDVDDLLDASATALASHNKQGALKWVMSPATFSELRKLKYPDGRYVLQTDLTADGTYRVLGSPIVLTDRLSNDVIALADWGTVAVARDASPSVAVDSSRYFEFDQTAIRVTSRYDFKPLDANRIILLKKVSGG